ncbi:MAG TPA: dTDP-4-dehydrorhamnose 3,5-epimerase [Desulfurivibrio alkaliphilus]|uniref:dTDP-4-dehydrorhamnose 3,5-epimerase n=1 Tax=Desulfurivibrio alkaliphilus TaxID=427923 RepID=A0A7C2XGA3_9BACT|nr:dTDP-4-dehydrorhamnose 3,5-epimerase [Desulfurivibrio alkaliphilus]
MKFTPTAIPEVILIEPQVFGDERGFFMETWHAEKFAAAGLDLAFVQDNHSRSTRGTLRGLHYQLKQPQGKLARVIAGEVFDVAVDLRRHAPTFGRWVGVTLSAANKRMLWVPPGFAHGFYVLSPEADFLYKCTQFYAPAEERVLRWDDPELAIAWPLRPDLPPLLSAKDRAGAGLGEAECYP